MLPYCEGGSLAGVPLAPPPWPIALKVPRTGEEVELGAMVDEVVTSYVAEDVTETVVELAEVVIDSVAESKVVDEAVESEEVEDVTGTDEVADSAEVSDVSSEVDESMVTALLILAGGFR